MPLASEDCESGAILNLFFPYLLRLRRVFWDTWDIGFQINPAGID